MHPSAMYADFSPTSCVWARELYLQQRRVSRSKTKFARGDCETADMDVHVTERWEVRTQMSHKHEIFEQESRPSNSSVLCSAVWIMHGDPWMHYSTQRLWKLWLGIVHVTAFSLLLLGWCFCSAAALLFNQWPSRTRHRTALYPDLRQTVFFHSVVKIS